MVHMLMLQSMHNVSCSVQNYQVDWEAILARSPEPFIQSVSPWLYPPAARETLQSAPSGQGLTADSARIEDTLADMGTLIPDGIGAGEAAGVSKAAPPESGQPCSVAVYITCKPWFKPNIQAHG